MSDGAELMKSLKRKSGVNYPVLIPNLMGYNIAVSITFKYNFQIIEFT